MYKKSDFNPRWVVAGIVAMIANGAAHAQSSVTLYGVVDSGILYTNKTFDATSGGNAAKQVSLIDGGLSPSRFGFTGTEDLGGGMKAEFKIESGINLPNGGIGNSNGNLFGRQAWVALDSNVGTLKVGLQYSPFFLAVERLDPRDGSLFGASIVSYVNNVLVTGIFNSNAVSYTSPVIAGFQGTAMYALGGTAGDFSAGRQYSGDLKYDNGTVMIDAAFYNGNAGGTAAQTPVPSTLEFFGRTLGVSYKIGKLTAKAAFASYKVAGSFSNNVYSGGLDYFVLPQLDIDGGVYFTSDRNNTTNHSVVGSIGVNYLLSRATTLYGQVGLVNNHGAMHSGLSANGATDGATGTTFGTVIGLRHTF